MKDDAAPHILFESAPSRPTAAIQAKGPLQAGDARLDPSAEVELHLVYPVALGHLENGQATLLGENGIPDLMLFGKAEIVLRGETAIGGNLTGHAPKAIFMPLQTLPTTIAVGGLPRSIRQSRIRDEVPSERSTL